jgi:hypothetical protein
VNRETSSGSSANAAIAGPASYAQPTPASPNLGHLTGVTRRTPRLFAKGEHEG